MVHSTAAVLNDTELYTFKWEMLCHMNFTSIKLFKDKKSIFDIYYFLFCSKQDKCVLTNLKGEIDGKGSGVPTK